MSKQARPTRQRQQSLFGGFAQERSGEAIERDVIAAMDDNNYGLLPREILDTFGIDRISIHDVAGTALFCDSDVLPRPRAVGDRSTCSMTEQTFRGIVKQAMAAGFVAALVNYRKQLAGVPALSRFYDRQKHSQRRGRETQSRRKQTRASEAILLAKAGKSIAEIVSHFRANGMRTCQRSTVYRWLKTKPPRTR